MSVYSVAVVINVEIVMLHRMKYVIIVTIVSPVVTASIVMNVTHVSHKAINVAIATCANNVVGVLGVKCVK